MNKDTSNVFSGGLNKDLNPIVTPNEILTDNVNGSFITFNGDEMSLQNDAGNTKILIPGTSNEYVKLKEGYTPIGIKEYGGVLYIVSSCRAFNEWDSTITYPINTKIYLASTKSYYISNKSTKGSSPNLLIDWIKYTLTDAEKLLEKVEFGSYPSPERPADENKGVISSTITKTLNTEISASSNIKFQAGVDVKFTHALDDTYDKNYITTYDSNGNKVSRKLYDIKLYHKLGSGLIDLTGYVNSKSATSNKLWFENNEITYKCYNNYKGTLVSKVELEKINKFELSQEIAYNSVTGDITFKFTTDSGCSLIFKKFILTYNLDGGSNVTPIQVDFSTLTNNTYVLNIPVTADTIFNYTIIPVFSYINTSSSEVIIDSLEISEYLKDYVISGSTLLNVKPLDYSLVPIKHALFCIAPIDGKMRIIEYVLMDSTETVYLTPTLVPVTDNKIYGYVDTQSREGIINNNPPGTILPFYVTDFLGEYESRTEQSNYVGYALRDYRSYPEIFPEINSQVANDIDTKEIIIDSPTCA